MLFDILKTAVFNPAKDKLHPDLYKIGFGNNYNTSYFAGRVGVGTNAPLYPLEVSGAGTVSLAYQRTGTGVTAKKWGFHSDNSNTYWQNITDSLLAITVSNAGNVGIGTTAPAAKLHVEDTGNASKAILFKNASNGSGAYAGLKLRSDQTPAADSGLYLNSSGNTNYAGANQLMMYQYGSNPIGFVTNNTIRMTVAGDGDVGIGTTSPAKELDVVGTVRAVDTSLLQHQLRPTQLISYGTDAVINAQSAGDDVLLKAQGNTRLIVTAEGNVGIGTTSPTSTLEVAGTVRTDLIQTRSDGLMTVSYLNLNTDLSLIHI